MCASVQHDSIYITGFNLSTVYSYLPTEDIYINLEANIKALRYKGIITTKDSMFILYNGNGGVEINYDQVNIKHKLTSSFSGKGL